ncbi:MAG: phosphoenolpyruvate carboxykinase (GTP) [Candidatus Altiarchaeales archaeon]|nr:MAG: phosphoenolpyruvate carboxykinase (GTP) [Candidatus Altiarchaeales archaeon]
MTLLKKRLDEENYRKIMEIDNKKLHQFIAEYIDLCNPDRIFIRTDSEEDAKYIREEAIRTGEERKLAIEGHTVHFDNYYDQARDKEHTKFLVPEGIDLGHFIDSMDKNEGLKEIRSLLKDSMKGHTMYILFFILGPKNSEFSIPAVQITDSSYVAHSEDLLYRPGYEEFKKIGNSGRFFRFVHSRGKLDLSKRRIYIDTYDNITYSVNTEYGGNTIGLKKLALRLAINLASKEGWLAEHMFIVGINGPNGRKTYFTGAFPSACGKTSTSMMDGETIIGDDIAYLRKKNGRVYAVNPERGIFGIIQDINSKEEPILWETLHRPGEIIFSNVLITEDNKAYWNGKDGDIPERGFNHSGEWFRGKKDKDGKEIPPSHKNARFTFNMELLRNRDDNVDNPNGVVIYGIIYGGRDSNTSVPVEESFNWEHGIITMGASLESETTAATLGEEGIRIFNPMSNIDFISIPIEEYIKNNLNFGRDLKHPPNIFSVNYFLRDKNGNFLNDKLDKRIWLKWMELRSHRDVEAIETPTGRIPIYDDLKRLFMDILNKNYSKEDYIKQFTIRVPENLSKIERIMHIYETKISDAPKILFKVLEEQRERLEEARKTYGDYISPDKLI